MLKVEHAVAAAVVAAAVAGANPLLSQPASKLPDGTVNFGREAGEKGIWNLPYITNMGARNIVVGAPAAPAPAPGAAAQRGGGGGGGGGGQRGGAPSEPWVPFKPWAAAVYNYHSMNETKYDPESMCTPPGGPRMFATPYPAEIIQIPSEKRIFIVYEGGTHVLARDLHGRTSSSGVSQL